MIGKIITSFNINKQGLDRVLGELERTLIGYLWQNGSATGKEIFDHISQHRENAYPTVLTVLNRMVKKGLLRKAKRNGLFCFSAVHDRETFEKLACQEAVRSAMEISKGGAISAIADLFANVDDATIALLERQIDEKRQKQKG